MRNGLSFNWLLREYQKHIKQCNESEKDKGNVTCIFRIFDAECLRQFFCLYEKLECVQFPHMNYFPILIMIIINSVH